MRLLNNEVSPEQALIARVLERAIHDVCCSPKIKGTSATSINRLKELREDKEEAISFIFSDGLENCAIKFDIPKSCSYFRKQVKAILQASDQHGTLDMISKIYGELIV